jgi:peptide/nickel transport system permease protein
MSILSSQMPEPESMPVEIAKAPTTSEKNSRFRDIWHIIIRNGKVMAGLIIIVFFILIAVIGPFLIKQDPNAFSADRMQEPSAAHWLGTTLTGQDVFSQIIVGARTSLFWGFLTGILVTFVSIAVGITAGYFGGLIDDALTLLINVFLLLPGFPLAIIVAAYFPFKGLFTVSLVIILTSWAYNARVLRAQTLTIRNRDFVEAARSSGESNLRIIFSEILPNVMTIVASCFISTTLYVILAAAALEFLGLGNPSEISWGGIFYWAQNSSALLQGAWWWFIPLGICIATLGAGLALINYGIDELANPLLRKEKKPRNLKIIA